MLSVLAACTGSRPQSPDVMTQTGTCDTVPPSHDGPASRVPAHHSTNPTYGIVVGAVSERGSGNALPFAMIDVRPDTAETWGVGSLADSLGGFTLWLSPGSYQLRTVAIAHRFPISHVTVQAAATETVRVSLRYYVCVGY